MGKLNHGPNTRARGKAGAFVYQQYEGMQVFKEYQPTVKNPNTNSQIASRAIFALSSKVTATMFPFMSAVMKANGINYERFQRGQVLRLLRANTTYDSTEEHAVLGSIPAFRPNGDTSFQVTNGAITKTGSAAAFSFEFYGRSKADPARVLLIALGNDGSLTSEDSIVTPDADASQYSATIMLPASFDGYIFASVYMLEESETGQAVSYGSLIGSTATNVATLPANISANTRYVMSNLLQTSIYVV